MYTRLIALGVLALAITIHTVPLQPVAVGKCAPPDGTDKQLFWRNCYSE
jgi:hypothetical protein